MTHCQAEGSGRGVPRVDRQGLAGLWVSVSPYSLLPKRVVVARGGLGNCMLVDKGGVWTGTCGDGPLRSPLGERALAGNGFAVRSRLDLVEGGTGGDATRGKGFETGHGVRGAIQNRRRPDGGELHSCVL